MNLYPFAERLESCGVGKMEETIFVQHMPDEVTKGVLVLEPLQGIVIDHELPGYLKGNIQIIARDRYIPDAMKLAEESLKALSLKNSDVIFGYHVNYIRPRHQPAAFPQSEGNLFEVYVNFDINCTENSINLED